MSYCSLFFHTEFISLVGVKYLCLLFICAYYLLGLGITFAFYFFHRQNMQS
jgi:hypothetical protein